MNAHFTVWHSYTVDHRGQLIANVISNSDHIILNTNTPTRVPNTTLQQICSADITTVSSTLCNYKHKQFTSNVRHATHKKNRSIDRATQNIQGYNIALTTTQVQEAIKPSKNNNSHGSDKLNIRHLKHIGPLELILTFLTSMFKTTLNNKHTHATQVHNTI